MDYSGKALQVDLFGAVLFVKAIINEGSLKGQFIHIPLFAFTVLNIFPYLPMGGNQRLLSALKGIIRLSEKGKWADVAYLFLVLCLPPLFFLWIQKIQEISDSKLFCSR